MNEDEMEWMMMVSPPGVGVVYIGFWYMPFRPSFRSNDIIGCDKVLIDKIRV